MQLLEDHIRREGKVAAGNVLRVDGFLNHQIDVVLLTKLAEEEHKENLNELKGDMSQASWGAQIRNYVFQPYTMVKDTRTGAETGNIGAVMDGDLDLFVRAKRSQDAKERNL